MMNASPRTTKPPSPTRHSKPKMKNDAWRSLSDLCNFSSIPCYLSTLTKLDNRCNDGIFADRSRQGLLDRPFESTYPILNCARRKSKLSIPLSLGQSLTIKFYEMVRASIIRLNEFRHPMTIFKTIMAIVVATINGMFRTRSIAHIGKEILKCSPAIANCYAPCAIIFVRLKIRIGTSVDHQVPDIVNRIAFASGLTMSSSWLIRSNPLFLQTPTRTRSVGAQHFTANPSFVAANTDAFPVSAMRASDLWLLIKNRPSIKCLAAKLNYWSHGLKLTLISMDYKGASHGI